MANQWLRLWHDMPTDPKWRTIAKASKQRIGDVIAVYTHMLVCASNASERGRTQSFNCEDVASALDLETAEVEAIVAAMSGRVLDGDLLMGWDKRQVSREDGGAERAKVWREAKKEEKRTQANASERSRTEGERKRTPDKDKDKDKDKKKEKDSAFGFAEFWSAYPRKVAKSDAVKAWGKLATADHSAVMQGLATAAGSEQWRKDGGQFIPHPATWLNGRRWEDEADAQPELIQHDGADYDPLEAAKARNFGKAA